MPSQCKRARKMVDDSSLESELQTLLNE